MRLLVEGLRYHSLDMPFVDGLKPYAHQLGTLDLVREAAPIALFVSKMRV